MKINVRRNTRGIYLSVWVQAEAQRGAWDTLVSAGVYDTHLVAAHADAVYDTHEQAMDAAYRYIAAQVAAHDAGYGTYTN